MEARKVVGSYLDLLDSQREAALATLDGLQEEQLWQRSAPREWSIGEILNHNYLLIASTLPYVRFAWKCLHWYGSSRRVRPYQADIPDMYRSGRFPMWVGFLWSPRHTPRRPVSLEQLKAELRSLHRQVRDFYAGKDEAVLGNISVYDPYFGWLNLIVTLRIGIYHDQLHYDDVVKLAQSLPSQTGMDRDK